MVIFFNLHQSSFPNIRFSILILIEDNKKTSQPKTSNPFNAKTITPNFLLLFASSAKEKEKARNPNIKAKKKQVPVFHSNAFIQHRGGRFRLRRRSLVEDPEHSVSSLMAENPWLKTQDSWPKPMFGWNLILFLSLNPDRWWLGGSLWFDLTTSKTDKDWLVFWCILLTRINFGFWRFWFFVFGLTVVWISLVYCIRIAEFDHGLVRVFARFDAKKMQEK